MRTEKSPWVRQQEAAERSMHRAAAKARADRSPENVRDYVNACCMAGIRPADDLTTPWYSPDGHRFVR